MRMRLQDRFGGHVVLGHVDTTLTLAAVEQVDECWNMVFIGLAPADRLYVIPKGSIAINGISLTIRGRG